MKSSEKYLSYRKPDEMVQDLFDSKSKLDNHDKLVLIYKSFDNIADKANSCHQVQINMNLSKY